MLVMRVVALMAVISHGYDLPMALCRCIVGQPFLARVKRTHGFMWVNDRHNPYGQPKVGLVATKVTGPTYFRGLPSLRAH
jgi:hypothetical protein